jgi:hypothetical protein
MSASLLICSVDDDQMLCASVADLLQAEGYRTAELGTATPFLASLDQHDRQYRPLFGLVTWTPRRAGPAGLSIAIAGSG